ncbi:alpha/beta hydrolase-fold protein [bacterium]|nr:alpha/beta hydrolase-fold protein [bacterium]
MSNSHIKLLTALFFAAGTLHANVSAEERTVSTKPQPGQQVERLADDPDKQLSHLLYLPEGYDENQATKWPLVLFLHGRGESNGPLSLVAKWGPPRFAQEGKSLPFILISPQCPRSGSWSDDKRQNQLDQLLKESCDSLNVDTTRIYLTGLSMGGYGSWTMAANHPEQFAAVIPICGGGDPSQASKLTKIPIWVFHGDRDNAVPIKKSISMVEAIQKNGGESIRFTTLEHVGHNSWSSAYAMPELVQWMLQHKTKPKDE